MQKVHLYKVGVGVSFKVFGRFKKSSTAPPLPRAPPLPFPRPRARGSPKDPDGPELERDRQLDPFSFVPFQRLQIGPAF